eukprot:TRINITY_DN967_c0_g1_i1.p1 TRINITY_DN967_c0_g1~~TRINITY_DN967_c0_g1_i1.p1  ORF type:complete len:638 (+),score=127.78 TRINITY_DN967_c0_g1_i1:140-2053(+)
MSADYGTAGRPGKEAWERLQLLSEQSETERRDVDAGCKSQASYYFYHPVTRLITAACVMVCNFLMYGQDPVSHSAAVAELPVVGSMVSWVYPKEWRFDPEDAPTIVEVIIRIGVLCVILTFGVVVGRVLVHHVLLRHCCRLSLCGWKHTDDDDDTHRCCGGNCCVYGRGERWWSGTGSDEFYMDRSERAPGWTRDAYERNELPDDAVGVTEMELMCPRICWPRKHPAYNKGAWLSMFTCTSVSILLASSWWNSIADAIEEPKVTDGIGMTYNTFGQVSCLLTWAGDCVTALMIADTVLQEVGQHFMQLYKTTTDGDIDAVVKEYPLAVPGVWHPDSMLGYASNAGESSLVAVQAVAAGTEEASRRFRVGYLGWGKRAGVCWERDLCGGWQVRIVFVWAMMAAGSAVVAVAVLGKLVSWDDMQQDFGLHGSDEFDRCMLAAVICALDVIVVLQDWEFPSFDTRMDIRMPGLRTADVNVVAGKKGHTPLFNVFITGKWMNYSMFVLVCLLDLSMLLSCIVYVPEDYGQYTDPATHEICTTHNETFANEIVRMWRKHKKKIAVYDERVAGGYLVPGTQNGTTDFCLPDRLHMGHAAWTVLAAAIPTVLAYVAFIWMLLVFNRKDRLTDEGRLNAKWKRGP